MLFTIGYVGTGLVIGAYVPQIRHLWIERCSAGISARAYALWVLASAVFFAHSLVIGDAVFMVTQLVNMVALTIIIVLARRFRSQVCAEHARLLRVPDASHAEELSMKSAMAAARSGDSSVSELRANGRKDHALAVSTSAGGGEQA